MFSTAWNGKQATFRPIKEHSSNSARKRLSDHSFNTLGAGDLKGAVKLPAGEDINEWLATNTVDFYNELSLIWGIICDVDGVPSCGKGEGFPPGFEYRWAEGKEAVSCSGPEYVEKVMTWVEDEINNEATFPSTEGTPFPKTFQKILSSIFSRLFRIYAIIYTNFFTQIESVGAAAHLNTSFKHFMLFVWEFELVKEQEFEALKSLTDELKEKYHNK